MALIIRNIRLIDPANNKDEVTSIGIENGRICKYGDIDTYEGAEVIDGTNLVAAPGFVDVHVHFRDPGQTHKECIHTGAMASVAGGYTSVVMMGNTVPTIDCADVLTDVLNRGAKEPLHIYSCVNATKGMKGEEAVDVAPLKKLGAVGVTDDGKPILNEGIFRIVCKRAAENDLPLSLHEENPEYISENGVNAGEAATGLGLTGSSRMAEISMIERDIDIAKETGVKLSIQHISTAEGVELVRKAKQKNLSVFAEATPHHFSLTDDSVRQYGTLAKMNPPLRKEEDMLAIRKGLADGTIDMIATDHAPHSAEEKNQPFAKAPSGIIGLETALPLAITNLVDTGVMDLSQLIRVMSVNPAKLYKLPSGDLSIGQNADIVIFDPSAEYIVPTTFNSRSTNSPFVGWKLKGKVRYTICDGKIVYRG